MGDIQLYRDRAEELRVRAEAAKSPDVAVGYLELAQKWEALAENAAALADRRDTPDQPEKRHD